MDRPRENGFVKELDEVIRKNGYVYTQVKVGKKGFIYEQRWGSLGAPIEGFEVFRRKVSPKVIFPGGREIPERVSFPGNNDFGKWAWAYRWNEYHLAEKKFHEMESPFSSILPQTIS